MVVTQFLCLWIISIFQKNSYKWAGLVSAEPPCVTFHEPRPIIAPLLAIKGGESHYEPKPCQLMTNMYKNAGSVSEMVIFPKSNHFFSHNGKFVRGKAVNGCADNPVVIKKRGWAVFLDGSIATSEIVGKKCRTQRVGVW